MVADDGSGGRELAVEQIEVEPSVERANPSNLLNLLSKFLQTPGNVLLIQGQPGTGKTTLAFELLRRIEGPRIGRRTVPPNRLYVSSRVSPTKLRKHFPWIHEVVDSMSGRTATGSWAEGLHDLRVSEADGVLSKVLAAKRSLQKGLLVIDSWEGALRNTTEEGRRMLESVILSDPDESKVGVILVSESGDLGSLSYLVDGIVTLSSSDHEGRQTRMLVVNKLRGLRVQDRRGLFSLEKGRFTFLPGAEFPDSSSTSLKIPAPIPHSATLFSTGSPDLDMMLNGGIRRGSSLLIDVNGTVPPEAVTLLLNIVRANFVNLGGSCFILPPTTYSSENVAESLLPFVGREGLEERVRIAEFNQALAPEKWRMSLKGNAKEDVAILNDYWNKGKAVPSSRLLTYDFDEVEQVYGDGLTFPGLSEIGASIRDSKALSIGIAYRPTKVREEFLRIADYYFKVENLSGSLLLYGVKPFTNIHGVEFAFERGIPSVRLTEIV